MGPTVGERAARTVAAIWVALYGSLVSCNAAWFPLLPGALLGCTGFLAMGFAVAGAGLVGLASRWRPDGPRPVGHLVAYAAASSGGVVLVLFVLYSWTIFKVA